MIYDAQRNIRLFAIIAMINAFPHFSSFVGQYLQYLTIPVAVLKVQQNPHRMLCWKMNHETIHPVFRDFLGLFVFCSTSPPYE